MKTSKSFCLILLASLSLSVTAVANQSAQLSRDEMLAPLHNPQADYPGSPERPITRSLLMQLRQLNDSGEVFQAWRLLAKQKDGYAQSATRIFGEDITVERCVVESNWKLVVGTEVRERLYVPYAQAYQKHYIDYLEANLRYPTTLDIEKMYQRTDDELGLPQSVSVDLMMNLVPEDWGRKIFFDELSSVLQIGRPAYPKRWFHYTNISDARAVPESIVAQDITVDQAKKLYKKAAGEIAKCMAQKLKPTPREDNREGLYD